jgi:hypothetical protein
MQARAVERWAAAKQGRLAKQSSTKAGRSAQAAHGRGSSIIQLRKQSSAAQQHLMFTLIRTLRATQQPAYAPPLRSPAAFPPLAPTLDQPPPPTPQMPNGLIGSLLGMGNPLLDISAVVDQAFLDKYEVGRPLINVQRRSRRRRKRLSTPHRNLHPPTHSSHPSVHRPSTTTAARRRQPDPGRGEAHPDVQGARQEGQRGVHRG